MRIFKRDTPLSRGGVNEIAETIRQTFADFDVMLEIVEAKEGLRAYHVHFRTVKPVRMRAIHSFIDDLRYALANVDIEIQAPILGKKLIGVTIPKQEKRLDLPWRSAITSSEYIKGEPLVVPLGKEEFGENYFLNIATLPHLLIAGTTGSGKTTLIHSLISSLIYKNSPALVRLILSDPKRTELSVFSDIPHLLTPLITDSKKTVLALKWARKEMERRFEILEKYHTKGRNCSEISLYHENILTDKKLSKEAPPMPYIVIVIDEVADIMQLYPRELETSIIRITQMGRAVGMHLVISTQRPDVKVVTGLMKANLPGRISLRVNSQIDSRVILDRMGAEKLTGWGDMLLSASENDYGLTRIQSFMITDEEIRKVCSQASHAKNEKQLENIPSPLTYLNSTNDLYEILEEEGEDDLYEEAKAIVIKGKIASTSYIQRRLRIGYSRAARLIDLLEARGVIGPAKGAKPRKIFE